MSQLKMSSGSYNKKKKEERMRKKETAQETINKISSGKQSFTRNLNRLAKA